MSNLQGGVLAGGIAKRGRVDNDYYATPPEATHSLMKAEIFKGTIWECACGAGHMAEVLSEYNSTIVTDLVDRGYGTPYIDFLKSNNIEDNIVTNPPFSLFQDFAQQAIKLARYKVALFGKIQALEGKKRATFLQESPLKSIYVFKQRVNPMRNGSPVDENGKKWSSTMAFAWYIWEKDYDGEPVVRWL